MLNTVDKAPDHVTTGLPSSYRYCCVIQASDRVDYVADSVKTIFDTPRRAKQAFANSIAEPCEKVTNAGKIQPRAPADAFKHYRKVF